MEPTDHLGGQIAGEGIAAHVLRFCRYLRGQGLKVTPGRVVDAARVLEHVDIGVKRDFYLALRWCLVAQEEELEIYDRAFSLFWDFAGERGAPSREQEDGAHEGEGAVAKRVQVSEPVGAARWSPDEVLGRKDWSVLSVEESQELGRLIRRVARRIATRESRRYRAARTGGKVHLRGTLRKNQSRGLELVELAWRRRRERKTRVVLLCDVSGSMDCYNRFLVQFMFGLQRELKNSRTAVFSTRLTEVTDVLRRKTVNEALGEIARRVVDWSGGTDIGGALAQFNRGLGKGLAPSSTVVIVVSDGYDRGDAQELAREMAALRRRCRMVIWINPLLGTAGYQPVAEGMRAALPYVDYFLAAHDLESLRAVSRVLAGTGGASARLPGEVARRVARGAAAAGAPDAA